MKNSEKNAFPLAAKDAWNEKNAGLTKKEYFAGMAMQALISNNKEISKTTDFTEEYDDDIIKIGGLAVAFSESLLESLEESGS